MRLNFKDITLTLLGSENKSGKTDKTFHIVVVFLITMPVVMVIKWLIDQLSRGNKVLVKLIFTPRVSPPFMEQKGSSVIENVQTDSDPNSASPSAGAGGSLAYFERLER